MGLTLHEEAWFKNPCASGRVTMREADLTQLLAAVLTARATQKAARGVSGAPGEDLRTARRACLHALDEYTQALKSHCFPVPYQLHMELLLLRGLCGLSSDSRNGASPTGGDIDRALQVIIKEAVATRSPSNRSRS